jgi:hypothetical protein
VLKAPPETVMLKHPTPTSVTVIAEQEEADSVVAVVIGVNEHPTVVNVEVVLQPTV